MKVEPYVNYGGNCAEAFRFYEEHLGGKILMSMTFDEMPGGSSVQPGSEKLVMYAAMRIGESVLMGNDVEPERYGAMRSAYLSLTVDSTEEAERIYKVLVEGGEIFMAMVETFFAHRFAMLRDRFGASWMVIHQKAGPA
jgi:PhnB protein